MKRQWRWICAGLLLAVLVAAPAVGGLCPKCKDMTVTCDIGKCRECGVDTSSGTYSLCPKCSGKLNKCELCGRKLSDDAPASHPATEPASRPSTEPASQPASAPAEKQGIRGKVIKMKGNFMPGVVVPGRPNPGAGGRSVEPLAVPVWIFKGKVKIHQQPDTKHKALVKVVQSGKDGTYKADLPPGEYTVVAEINGKLYLNRFDGKGNWSTVQVKADIWTEFVIEDSSEAVF